MKWIRLRLSGGGLVHMVSLLLPMLLACGIFAALGIFPFGEKSLLVADMNNEYIDYLAGMNRAVRSGGSFLRSWNMGMGLNMLGLVAFYTSSPWNLLVLLFPVEVLTEVVFGILLLKIGLCGLTFSILVQRRFASSQVAAVGLAVAYSLCAYNIAYSSNIMWLDGVAALPLVILGLHRLAEEKRGGLLLASLAYTFFCSYYTGYMIALFTALYATAYWFSQNNGALGYVKFLLRILGCGAMAAACCAVLLVPAYCNLRHGQEEMFQLTAALALQSPFVETLAGLLPGSFYTLTDSGTPNIYCTVLCAGGAALYFFNSRISSREKLAYGLVTVFLLLSFSCEFLYLGWHAFEDPTWFPARFSFVFSFWLLLLAARCMHAWRGISLQGVLWAGGILLFLLLEAVANQYEFLDPAGLWLTLALVLAYSLLGVIALGKQGYRGLCAALAVTLLCVEAVWNGWVVVDTVDRQFHYRHRDSYVDFREAHAPLLEWLKSEEEGVYRTELVRQRNANGGLALGYYPISHYSTTTDQSLNGFLKQLGYNTGTINELRYTPNTPLTGGLLGIRYILSPQPVEGYRLRAIGETGDLAVYENPAAFPLAFFADQQALDFAPMGEHNPFLLQNRWTASLWRMEEGGAPEMPFRPVAQVEECLIYLEKEEREGYLQYRNLLRRGDAYVEWMLQNPEKQEIFAFFPVHNRQYTGATVRVGQWEQRELSYRNNTVLSLGNAPEITLRLSFAAAQARIKGGYFYALDLESAKALADTARQHQMEFTVFQDTREEGRVLAPRDGVLLTTFPYDSGWRVSVDGRRVQTQTFAGVFLALPLESGEHKITMRYAPPGFWPGLVITLAAVAGLLTRWLWLRGFIHSSSRRPPARTDQKSN